MVKTDTKKEEWGLYDNNLIGTRQMSIAKVKVALLTKSGNGKRELEFRKTHQGITRVLSHLRIEIS